MDKKNRLKLIKYTLFFSLLQICLILLLSSIIDAGYNPEIERLNYYYKIFLALIVAPLLETFFFQFFIIEASLAILKRFNPYISISVAILFSALSFSLIHLYDLNNFFIAFISGTHFAYVYVLCRKRKLYPFLVVCLVHFNSNLFALIANEIL